MNEQTCNAFFWLNFLGVRGIFWDVFFFKTNMLVIYIYIYIHVDSLKQKQENWLQVEEGRLQFVILTSEPGIQPSVVLMVHPKMGGYIYPLENWR